MLSKAVAQNLTKQAQGHARELARLLVQLHDQEAWRVLGYPSWSAYIAANFDESLRTIYRYIRMERVRTVLADVPTLARFTGEALEALASTSDDQIRGLADIAARSTNGRIGADVIHAVQTAIAETLTTGAVELEDGSQAPVVDALVNGVQGKLREQVNSQREYIVANMDARLVACTYGDTSGDTTQVTFWFPITVRLSLFEQNYRISIWREVDNG